LSYPDNFVANILDISLAIKCVRLIDRKSPIDCASCFLGSNTIWALFRCKRCWSCCRRKKFNAAMTSSLITVRLLFKNTPMYPSGPGALSAAISLITVFTSSSVNSSSRCDKSCRCRPNSSQFSDAILTAGCPKSELK
jgi:hypothetical protein